LAETKNTLRIKRLKMKGEIIQTETEEQIKETKKRLKRLRKRNRELPLLLN